MKRDRLAARMSRSACVAMTAALEYLASEILEISGNNAEEDQKKRISNRHILLAIKNDDELAKVFHGIVLREGGVLPHVNQALLPQKKGAKNGAAPATQEA